MTKYYIIETSHVGPNQDEHVDAATIEIRTSPARIDGSHEVCIDGWCGTTNKRAVYAHGEYDTIEEARAEIAFRFGVVRDAIEPDDNDDESVVETYKPGKYAPMSRQPKNRRQRAADARTRQWSLAHRGKK